MIGRIVGMLLRRTREYGGLSREDVAKAIGRKPQVIWRWEEKGQMPSREQAAILVQQAKLTPLAFVHILREALAAFAAEEGLVFEPAVGVMARAPLIRATRKYAASFDQLDEERRASIEARLNQGRLLDSVAEQMCGLVEAQVVGEIEGALEAKRKGSAS